MSKKIMHAVFAFAFLIGGLMALGVPAQAQGVAPNSDRVPNPAYSDPTGGIDLVRPERCFIYPTSAEWYTVDRAI